MKVKDLEDLIKLNNGQVEDAYKAGDIPGTWFHGYRLAHTILVTGSAHERATNHIPTRVVAREMIKLKGHDPDEYPDLALKF